MALPCMSCESMTMLAFLFFGVVSLGLTMIRSFWGFFITKVAGTAHFGGISFCCVLGKWKRQLKVDFSEFKTELTGRRIFSVNFV